MMSCFLSASACRFKRICLFYVVLFPLSSQSTWFSVYPPRVRHPHEFPLRDPPHPPNHFTLHYSPLPFHFSFSYHYSSFRLLSEHQAVQHTRITHAWRHYGRAVCNSIFRNIFFLFFFFSFPSPHMSASSWLLTDTLWVLLAFRLKYDVMWCTFPSALYVTFFF